MVKGGIMKKPNFAAMNPAVAEAIKQMMAEQGDKFSLEKSTSQNLSVVREFPAPNCAA